MNVEYLQTKIGLLKIIADDKAILKIRLNASYDEPESGNAVTKKCAEQLSEYFSGRRTIFDIPVNPEGTDFQLRVWQALCNIPYGETCCYGDIAKAIGRPKAQRAVGTANNRNPVPIIIPCHRVIGKNGDLTGYAGGVDIKKQLLELEKQTAAGD